MKLRREFLKTYLNTRIIALLLICYVFLNTSLSVTLAGPEGAEVVNGQVSFQQNGNNTFITASDKSIVNYSSFDIARQETVQFIQPNSSASVLNRIISANPTNINGTLLANGRVFFVNPAGVYIGNGARINVNQLVASGLNISNADFINGRYNFVGGNGAVINDGDISAQQVNLIGKQVTNSGNINCPAGYVVMAAGDRIFLGEPGSEDVVLEIDTASLPDPADLANGSAVLNEGTVDAAGGTIVLAAAGDVYSLGISNVGSLSASIETGHAGQVELVAPDGQISNTGSIEAKSNSGTGGTVIAECAEVINSGTVDVTGSEGGQVTIEASSRLGQFGAIHADATETDGGAIDLWAGDVVALSSDSLTTASAGLNGNGGEITVFSPDTALFWPDAIIEAKGGSESGDGGFVEVSGKEHVEIYGLVDTSAVNGENGTFLIDPSNVRISGGDNDGFWDVNEITGTWTPTGSDSVANVNEALKFGNVFVTTNNPSDNMEGDIIVENSVTAPANANNLTLQAANDIVLIADIVMSAGTGNLTLTADWGDEGAPSDGYGAIINDGGTITMGTGHLKMEAAEGIGTTASPIETNATTLEAWTRTGGIYIKEVDDVGISGDVVAEAGRVYLEASNGGMTYIGGSIESGIGSLTMRQYDSIDTESFNFLNQLNTNLILESFNGSITSDNSGSEPLNAADQWKSITAIAKDNIELRGTGDIRLGGNLTSETGGISIISDSGTVLKAGDTILDNITITANPAAGGGVDLDPAKFSSGKAAIVIRTYYDLTLGSNAELIANGIYNPQQYDDRSTIDFIGGNPIDVGIYLRSYRTNSPPSGYVSVGSNVTIGDNGTMVVDAGEKVTFEETFNESVFNFTNRLEVVSRVSVNLNEVQAYDRLPYADNPGAIRDWFVGTYTLRGTSIGGILEIVSPAGPTVVLPDYLKFPYWWLWPPLPWPVPLPEESPEEPSEPEDDKMQEGEVEESYVEALNQLMADLGITEQPGLAKAYPPSLNTDLYILKAMQKLVKLQLIIAKNETRIASLRKAVAQFFPTLDSLSEEQMVSFIKTLESHKGDGTDFDLAGQCIFVLREYVNILVNEVGLSVEKSVEFVMKRYVEELTEGDLIRMAVVQMHLEQFGSMNQ